MEATKCIGKVLQNGQVSIPLDLFAELGLIAGDEIEVTLKKLDVKKNIRRKKADEVSLFSTPEAAQKRMSELLFKNREGRITQTESLELEKLVFQTQIRTLEKAKKLYEEKNNNSESRTL
jgi:bifunctional DNA-binding transcriptional regulator/antitoxin component of YhaV-PrlF toxin-antitoxin module